MKKMKKFFLLLPLLSLLCLLLIPARTYAVDIQPAYAVLANTTGGMGLTIATVWKNLLNIINGAVVVVLIVVAFAQILRINLNTYGFKKILPALVMAIIAANFSFLVCRLMVDIANVAIGYLTECHGAASCKSAGTFASSAFGDAKWASPGANSWDLEAAVKAGDGGTIFWFLILQLLLIAAAIVVLILAFLFFIRLWVIYFLVALSGGAFMMMVLPQTKGLFNTWWKMFSQWVFMPVASVFWLWLGSQWIGALGLEMSAKSGEKHIAILLPLLFGGVCFYFAITTPFKLGGAIMNKWGSYGKQAWGKTGGAYLNGVYGRQKDKLANRLTTVPDKPKDYDKLNAWQRAKYQLNAGIARPGNQLDKMRAKQRYFTQQEKDVRAKAISNADKSVYFNAYKEHMAGTRPLDKARLGRLKAKLRGYIGDERETYGNLTPDLLKEALKTRHALDGSGKLKTEAQLAAELTDSEFIETKAIINRARQLMNSTIYKEDTEAIMNGGADKKGVVHPGIIPAAYSSKWRAGDIASDLFASSEVMQNAAEDTDAGLTVAHQLGGIRENLLKHILDEGTVEGFMSKIDSSQRGTLQGPVEDFYNHVNGIIQSELQSSLPNISKLENGRKELEMILNKDQMYDPDPSKWIAHLDSKAAGLNDTSGKLLSATDAGMRNDQLKAISNARMAAEEYQKAISSGGSADIVGSARQKALEEAKATAEVRARSELSAPTVVQTIAQNPNTTVSQMASGDQRAIESLTQHVEQLTHAMTGGISAFDTSNRQLVQDVIKGAVRDGTNEALKSGSLNVNSKLSDISRAGGDQQAATERIMARAVEMGTKKALETAKVNTAQVKAVGKAVSEAKKE